MIRRALCLCSTLVVLLMAPVTAWADDESSGIPYPGALDDAAISVDRLDSILDYALLLGNGDVNALLFSDRGELVLRLTKNDVWDARLDTSDDPPLMPIRRIKGLAKGDWPEGGSFTGGMLNPDGTPYLGPNNWSRPYPCPRACADVRLGSPTEAIGWQRIRAEGSHNSFERHGNAAVMSIAGKAGDSNGYAHGPLDLTTDDYPNVRVKLTGTQNARFYVQVDGPNNDPVFGSKWIETPTRPEERVLNLPAGKRIGRIILYTWTEDGRRAENRFESVTFGGPRAKHGVNLEMLNPPTVPAKLDIRRAVAHVNGQPRATIRALAQRNVFLIHSPAEARLTATEASYELPKPETGNRKGVKYLHQTLPGDPDWPGMSFAVSLAQKGQCKSVAIVTSLESKDIVADAVKLARQTLLEDHDELLLQHESQWQRFWSASGVDIDSEVLRQVWYQNLYFMRCVSRPGAACVGLFAGLVNDQPAWHGGHTTNYNAEQTFWSGLNANHLELLDPYVQLITDYLPRARWLCREVFDCEGAYFPHNIFLHEPPDPEKCHCRNNRQYFWMSWSYTIGVSGFTVQNLWLKYKYAPERQYLEQIAYPAVRDVALFYANFMDQCERTADGKVMLGPSVSPEHWGWTKNLSRNYNCALDIAMARYTFQAAIEGATTLGRDSELTRRFRKALTQLPSYPTTGGDEPVVVDVEGAPPITYNITVPTTPVFPGDVVTWFSSQDEKQLFARTIGNVLWNGNNSTFLLAVGRARLSLPGTVDWLRSEIQNRLRPDRLITLNRLGEVINNYGHYTEQFAASTAVGELLLQSVGDIIRVFPAWPIDKYARFTDLRAQGGFLVSAEVEHGTIRPIRVKSTVGGKLRLLNPWPGAIVAVQRDGEKTITLKPDEQGILVVETARGEVLTLAREDAQK